MGEGAKMLRRLEGLSCVQAAENHKILVRERRKPLDESRFFLCVTCMEGKQRSVTLPANFLL
jgi:hypothetical protein